MNETRTDRQTFLDAERAKWLSIDEAAYVLGTSHTTIRSMVSTGRLAHRREGRVIRIHLDSLTQPTEVPHAHATVSNPRPLAALSAESVLDAARRRFRAAAR